MNNLLTNMSERGRLLILCLLICIPSILISFYIGGYIAMAAIFCFIIFILLLTKSIWLSKDHGRYSLIRYTIVIMVAAIGLPTWKSNLSQLVANFLTPIFPSSPKAVDIASNTSPYFTLTLLTLLLVLINYWLRDKTGMIKHSTPVDDDFPESNYKQQFKRFCRVINKIIDDLDLETNWSVEDFTPLDAQVEIRKKAGRRKKLSDLLTSIKNDHTTKVFLVLGDPGSGKSVALRKLCKDLLKESEKTNKIPIYINLKEWHINKRWTVENPPNSKQLIDFIQGQLKGKDVFADEFLKKYFHKMMETGRFFFILDSFDEIPMVLDEKENSWLIDKLSEVIFYTLAGANDSRGVLASRFFRKPTSKFDAKTNLIIRPFSDEKISKTLSSSLAFDESLLKKLFNERIELIPVARNPFTNSLMGNYVKNNNFLPKNQADMYHDYIYGRLLVAEDLIKEKDLSFDDIFNFSKEIAYYMFESEDFGMEIPISLIIQNFNGGKAQDIINILVYCRISRIGQGSSQKFSFVHRRFNEYFVAKKLLETPNKIPKTSIPEDSRWRDALVLYCEVAPFNTAKEIANFCWQEISQIEKGDLDLSQKNLSKYLRAMHSLRFLNDAYKGRKDCLVDFEEGLYKVVKHRLVEMEIEEINLVEAKHAVEATGLLKESELEEILPHSFLFNDSWISETAINSCKHLPKLSSSVQKEILEYFNGMPDYYFIANYKNMVSPLKYSESMQSIYKIQNFRYFFTLLFYTLFPIWFFNNTMFFFIISPLYILVHFELFLSTPKSENRGLYIILDLAALTIFCLTINIFKFGKESAFAPRIFSYSIIKLDFLIYFTCAIFFMKFLIYHINGGLFNIRLLKEIYRIPSSIVKGILFIFFLIFSPIIKIFFNNSYKKLSNYFDRYFYILKEIFSGVMGLRLPFRILYASLFFIYVFDVLLYNLLKRIPSELEIKVFSINILLLLVLYLKDLIYDKLNYDKITNKLKDPIIERAAIYSSFYSFHYSYYRKKFIKWIEVENKSAKGHWKDGKIPYISGDVASSLLAQLEEKWLGLS